MEDKLSDVGDYLKVTVKFPLYFEDCSVSEEDKKIIKQAIYSHMGDILQDICKAKNMRVGFNPPDITVDLAYKAYNLEEEGE